MNKYDYQYIDENNYFLSNKRLFICDKEILFNKYLSKIEFPMMVFDTEFINQSHNKVKNTKVHIKKNQVQHDTVFLINYAVFENIEQLLKGKYQIKDIVIKRPLKEFSLKNSYQGLKKTFLNVCINNKIKTLMCSGGAADIKLVKTWTTELFKEEEYNKFNFINGNNPQPKLNFIDVYDILKASFSFENINEAGEEFINQKRLKKGHHNKKMLEIPSFSKLYSWAGSSWKTNFRSEKKWEIYDLCTKMYDYYTFENSYQFNNDQYNYYQNLLKVANDHCWNDVYKIIYFLNFCYSFKNEYGK